MKIGSFEDILAWQQAHELVTGIYSQVKAKGDYGFRDQITRAAVSIMNNIAEGFERGSDKEFRQFLFIAKGSCGEVRSMLLLAKDFGYVSPGDYEILKTKCISVSRMLSGFIKSIK